MCLSPRQSLAPNAIAGERSSIDFAEHDVERADDRRHIGEHVSAADREYQDMKVKPVSSVGGRIRSPPEKRSRG